MPQYVSFQVGAQLLRSAARGYQRALNHALDDIGQAVAAEAHSKIGHYQPAMGQYPAWAPLAPATIASKAKKGLGMGGNPNTPLYATGKFSRDIGHRVNAQDLAVQIGTRRPYIVYTELGTSQMPPRPVFGPAALAVVPRLLPKIAHFAAVGIAGAAVYSWPQASNPQGTILTP